MKPVLYSFFLLLPLYACNSEPAPEEVAPAPQIEDAGAEFRTEEADHGELSEIDTDEARIATAVLAAPEASRAGAKVIGYNAAGEFVTLREGTNEFICLADDPNQDGFSAACYHKDLEPFMARGRELKAEGKSAQEIFAMREDEVKSKKLSMGPAGTALHIYYGPEARYDAATGKVPGAQYRYVVYMPYATAASTGLPESPVAPNHPWIMDPGTHRAHIMISPLAGEE
ncbi:hypothetical protein GGR26_000099 [Lewinella marina]|uniref:Uncharacterized protein n=1 Tax=Neolewinella marina TaxID=438751 RepID=A0A2G0CKE9_9BACT|nr:hypothetical protein [Neolewinella marina]NJB84354.1 hypothetical protein [Neolewinella marina]PHL00447.1 hypothetical protein CGL56_05290 [Neolewinella marina]